jgi:hypothetical protein
MLIIADEPLQVGEYMIERVRRDAIKVVQGLTGVIAVMCMLNDLLFYIVEPIKEVNP